MAQNEESVRKSGEDEDKVQQLLLTRLMLLLLSDVREAGKGKQRFSDRTRRRGERGTTLALVPE